MIRRVTAVSILWVLLTPAPGGAAALYDPALTWRTIESPGFSVHYPDDARNLAIRVSRIAEEVRPQVAALFGNDPEGVIDIVLADTSDEANGSATVLPKNTVRLYLTAPTELTGLSSYDDWLRILIIHELAHVCDIDQTWGLTRFFRLILGKYIAMNGLSPQFLSEGVAVFAETMLTNTGRGRSSYVAMLLRMAALDDRFVAIDQANVQYSDWPGGNVAYFYGGFFHLWLRAKYGTAAVRRLHQYYAATPLPYLYWFGASALFGSSLPALWQQWQQEELALAREIEADVIARGPTPMRRVTFHGRNITGVRYSPDQSFVLYSRTSPVDGSTVRRVRRDGSDDTALVLQTFSPRFSFTPDGSGFYYSQANINERFDDFNDLYRFDLATADSVLLKDRDDPDQSLRARDPDVSQDGRRLVFVQNRLHQSYVTVGTLGGAKMDTLALRVLVPPAGDMQFASPRFSPDGRRIALSVWFEGGRRDIVLVDAASGAPSRRLTFDRAEDGNPAWSPDGRYVLYESDADGISNLYAYDLADDRYFRVTRVVGGAFQPDVSADGKWLLLRAASGNGFDIFEMPFAPETWTPQAYTPDQGYGSESATAAAADRSWARFEFPAAAPREAEPPLPLAATETDQPYSPWSSLLPFHDNWNLQPVLYFLNGDPTALVLTQGADAVLHHRYVVAASSSYYTKRLSFAASYTNDVWYPTLAVGAAEQAYSYELGRYREDRLTGTASIAWPVKLRHLLVLSYTNQRRRALTTESERALALGDFGWVELGYRYRFTRHFPYSVGEEHGASWAIGGRWYGRALGADFDEALATLDARLYVNNPLFDNQVLALRAAGAMALGPQYHEKLALGGAAASSIFTLQTELVYPLRGFPLDYDRYPAGTGVAALYVEYRLPLWHVQRGLWTLPILLQTVHLALFTDVGNTFGDGSATTVRRASREAWREIRAPRAGAGTELRADLSLGWMFPLTLRLGVAWPVLERGRPRAVRFNEDKQIYFTLGTPI
ncbi:MAG: PD40 domain-containing protein [Deltaproteobacteria bacterium]|nr:PD40 domain-containing protein [Deltaproteobacteria bacterium]